jgi:hypothetical protein
MATAHHCGMGVHSEPSLAMALVALCSFDRLAALYNSGADIAQDVRRKRTAAQLQR